MNKSCSILRLEFIFWKKSSIEIAYLGRILTGIYILYIKCTYILYIKYTTLIRKHGGTLIGNVCNSRELSLTTYKYIITRLSTSLLILFTTFSNGRKFVEIIRNMSFQGKEVLEWLNIDSAPSQIALSLIIKTKISLGIFVSKHYGAPNEVDSWTRERKFRTFYHNTSTFTVICTVL